MSTRAIIQLVEMRPEYRRDAEGRLVYGEDMKPDPTGRVTQFMYATMYQHWDGYPEWRGRVLARACKAVTDDKPVQDVQYTFMRLLGTLYGDGANSLYLVECTKPVGHVNMGEEYEYVIQHVNGNAFAIRVYETPLGEDGKGKLIFEGTPDALLERWPKVSPDENEPWWNDYLTRKKGEG